MLDLDVDVLWMSRCTYPPGSFVALHSHDFFHWMYVAGGSCSLSLGGQTRATQAEEFYLIAPGVPHEFTIGEAQYLKTIEFKFRIRRQVLREKLVGLGERLWVNDTQVRRMCEAIIGEGLVKSEYRKDIIDLAFLEIIMHLLRLREQSAEQVAEQSSPELTENPAGQGKADLSHVIAYMKKNLDRPLSLEDLARHSGWGRSYFNRLFRSAYGITPIRYFNLLRIAKAKELMRYSDQNISQIAYSVGYEDAHYFSRTFKRMEQMTPQEYMKKTRGSLYIYLDSR